MAKYDGLIIPRSYSEYINKTDSATLQQALQQSGVLDSAPTEDSVKAVKSGGVFDALAGKQPTLTFDDEPTDGSTNPVKSNGIYDALAGKVNTSDVVDTVADGNMNPITSNAVADAQKIVLDPLTLTYTMKSGYTAQSIFIDIQNIGFGDLRVIQIGIVNIAGNGIGTTGTTEIANTNLRPKQQCFAISFEYTMGKPCRLSIKPDGTLVVMESPGIQSGSNNIFGVFIMAV